MQEQHRQGLDYVQTASVLLRRVRSAHPTAGLLEAADLQWWWRTARPTDSVPQLFWFDERGRPAAAVIATAWGDTIALDPIVMPGAAPEWLDHVIERGLAHARDAGIEPDQVVIDPADEAARAVLYRHGFTHAEGGCDASPDSLCVVTAWRAVQASPALRPAMGPPPQGYRLLSRAHGMARPHHMIRRSGPDVEARLRQTSLYRPDLDLFVLDAHDSVAAYALFWFDPETATGLVEPMRTEDGHQRRGLARHLLTAGIHRLAQAGATRVKLCFKPANPAARDLYLGVGFEPDRQSVPLSRRAG
jgi:GNAT superfamily N-acetyltransferase